MAVPCTVTAGQLSIRGLSLGGIETSLHCPQLGVAFDCGHCPRSLVSTPRLFITHGHADHAAGLVPWLSLRLVYGFPEPLDVFAPEWLVPALRTVVAAYESVQTFPYRVRFHALEAGSEVPLPGGRFVRAFRSPHVLPTMGYTVWERVTKLLPEFSSLPGAEIAARKRAGEALFSSLDRPILSFPGDTTIGVLDKQPHLYESRVLLLEATYIDDKKDVAACLQHGHVHLDQVLERAEHFRNEHIVFTHFSQSYTPREAEAIVRARTQGRFAPEIHAFVPSEDSWPG